MSNFLQRNNFNICPQLSLKNQRLFNLETDVKIAYYNDNNRKRCWQKSALFAIANRIFPDNILTLYNSTVYFLKLIAI
jgi:hypothetical protein